jgi:hypothetical protein
MNLFRPFGAAVLMAASMTTYAFCQDADIADFDHDGSVSLDEAKALADLSWNALDPLGKGVIDPAKAVAENGATAAAIGKLRPNAQGLISRDDFLAAVPARFRAADGDGDGALNPRELAAYLSAPRG